MTLSWPVERTAKNYLPNFGVQLLKIQASDCETNCVGDEPEVETAGKLMQNNPKKPVKCLPLERSPKLRKRT
jgi:hypothetical protein